MLNTLDPRLELLSTFELVVLLAALARMHYTPSTQWLTHYFEVSAPRINNCGPGHLTLLLKWVFLACGAACVAAAAAAAAAATAASGAAAAVS